VIERLWQDGLVSTFDVEIADPTRGVACDFSSGSKSVIVAFGGLFTRMGGIPPFEFFGQLDGVATARVFIRDLEQAWYQCGVQGVAPDIRSSAHWLGELLRENEIDRIVCIGCSAGGFAAMIFGALLGADEVHAFAPQTSIRRIHLLIGRDRRWNKYLKAMKPKVDRRSALRDVKPVVASRDRAQRIALHWGARDRRDGYHARRLAQIPGVDVIAYEGLGHNDLTRALRDRGELRRIITAAIG
jgi:hypothetical protein